MLKCFPSILILMTQVPFCLFFSTRVNLKVHNISVTHKMVKKVIMNFDTSKVSSPDCISVVVLKNCEPELSYILANSSVSVWRSLVFQIVGRSYQWSLYLKMLAKGIQLKTTAPFRAWRIRNLGTRFFMHLMTCLCTQSCTSHFVCLK